MENQSGTPEKQDAVQKFLRADRSAEIASLTKMVIQSEHNGQCSLDEYQRIYDNLLQLSGHDQECIRKAIEASLSSSHREKVWARRRKIALSTLVIYACAVFSFMGALPIFEHYESHWLLKFGLIALVATNTFMGFRSTVRLLQVFRRQ